MRPSLLLAAVAISFSVGRCPPLLHADDLRGLSATLLANLQTYCSDCHAGESAEAGLDFDSLSMQLDDIGNFATWERIFDRVTKHEMPPADYEAMRPDDHAGFVAELEQRLTAAHRATKSTVLRRLNRREYQNTLNDMFGTHLDLASLLPEDGRSYEFDNIGAALSISAGQLQQYMDSIDTVIQTAVVDSIRSPEAKTWKTSYADTREGENFIGKAWKLLDDGAVVFFRGGSYPTGMLRTASSPKSGYYRIQITGYAYQSDAPIVFAVGATTFQRGLAHPTYGYRSFAPGEAQTIELIVWMEERYMLELTPWGIADVNYDIKKNGLEAYQGPGLAIQSVQLTGPIEEHPSRGHSLLYEGVGRQEVLPSNLSQREKSWYQPTFELASENLQANVRQALRRIATAAFRRPSQFEDINDFMALFNEQVASGQSADRAFQTTVAAIFCSPKFLFLQENTGLLDDYALATRLSYFLSRTSPDSSLLESAASRHLTQTGGQSDSGLVAHTRRLINDQRFERFVQDFTDTWLNLREIDFTNPDEDLYPEFDDFLKFSMLEETRSFMLKLFRENLPVETLIAPDFAMLNNRLALHYGIDGVDGPEIRPVVLPAGSPRGGVLGQASVLKVTANGTTTSPVVRGVWVVERLLGEHTPPPPPGVPGVEPDIRGAITLRELLEKHRSIESCNSCHRVIDPPGFALECFDPIGGWRDRFRSLGAGETVNLRILERKVRYKLGPLVDASGQLPDGQAFDGFHAFRDLLLEDRDRLAKALIAKLLTFATGRDMGFSDRPLIEAIVQQSRVTDHRLGDMLLHVVRSEIFRAKDASQPSLTSTP